MKNHSKHMENNISRLAVENIKQRQIKPRPKLKFIIKKSFAWLVAFVSIICGSLAFAVTLYLLFDYDQGAFSRLGAGIILHALPYFWFIFLFAFIGLGEFYYRHTTFGHRYRLIAITLAYIAITVLAGSIGYAAGLGSKIENGIANNIPLYQKYLYNKESVWTQPESGLLSGTIISIDGQTLTIADFNNTKWKVEFKNALVRGRVKLEAGEKIKIIGEKTAANTFSANEIRPWQGAGRGGMNMSGS
jgi:hypothetical protein